MIHKDDDPVSIGSIITCLLTSSEPPTSMSVPQHLHALSPGDVVVLDRGDFSYTLLTILHQRHLHPVFRIPQSFGTAFKTFRDGDQDDVPLNLMPPKDALRNMQANGITPPQHPIPLRLVRSTIKDSRFMLATTLIDTQRDPLNAPADLSHGRWSIEELYKTLKHTTTLEHVHGKNERGVRQELSRTSISSP